MANDNHSSDLITACTFIQKGGVGKSTTLSHTGVALANEGYDVLLIDLAGKQGDLAKQFGIDGQLSDDRWPNISTVFDTDWGNIVRAVGKENILRSPKDVNSDSMVADTDEGVDLIPAHDGLDSVDNDLGNDYDGVERYTQLDSFIEEFVAPHYSCLLIDLPGMANNVSYSGVFAAQNVLAPVPAGRFEYTQVEELEHDLQFIRENYDRDTEISMIIPNMIDSRTTMSNKYPEKYGEKYADELAPVPVPRSQDIVNAQDMGKTIFELEEPSSTAQRAREAYEVNALELVDRIEEGDA